MTSVSQRRKWKDLITDWQLDLTALWQRNQERWDNLGLPDVSELTISEPDQLNSLRLATTDRWVASFYTVTDGWPLWLGSYGVFILRASDTDLMSNLYSDAFEIAAGHAPLERDVSVGKCELSSDDLKSAIALSGPDAREFVLSLTTEETVLYSFSSILMFGNFYDFMEYRRDQVVREYKKMLR